MRDDPLKINREKSIHVQYLDFVLNGWRTNRLGKVSGMCFLNPMEKIVWFVQASGRTPRPPSFATTLCSRAVSRARSPGCWTAMFIQQYLGGLIWFFILLLSTRDAQHMLFNEALHLCFLEPRPVCFWAWKRVPLECFGQCGHVASDQNELHCTCDEPLGFCYSYPPEV